MDVRQLAILLDVRQALSAPLDLKPALERVLQKLESGQHLVRGAVMLRGQDGDGDRILGKRITRIRW